MPKIVKIKCYNNDSTIITSSSVLSRINTKRILSINGISAISGLSRIALTKPTLKSNSFTYDGQSKTVELLNYNNSYMIQTGITSAAEAGTYEIVISIRDKAEYEWADKTTDDISLKWKIERDIIQLPIPSQNGTLAYTGSTQSPVWSNYNTTYMTISGTVSNINFGTYAAIFSLKDKVYTSWNDGTTSDKTVYWSIGKKSITAPSLSTTNYTYTGNTIEPSFVYDNNYVIKSGTYSGINVQAYSASFALKDKENTQWSDGTTSDKIIAWNISKKSITIPTVSGVLAYTGSAQSPNWNNYDANYMTISGDTSKTDTGTYIAIFSLIDTANTQWSNGTITNQSVSWTIQKVQYTVTISGTGNSTYNYVTINGTKHYGAKTLTVDAGTVLSFRCSNTYSLTRYNTINCYGTTVASSTKNTAATYDLTLDRNIKIAFSGSANNAAKTITITAA